MCNRLLSLYINAAVVQYTVKHLVSGWNVYSFMLQNNRNSVTQLAHKRHGAEKMFHTRAPSLLSISAVDERCNILAFTERIHQIEAAETATPKIYGSNPKGNSPFGLRVTMEPYARVVVRRVFMQVLLCAFLLTAQTPRCFGRIHSIWYAATSHWRW